MTVGQIVLPKRGRDKGTTMIIIAICGEYAYLADGVKRLLEKPKKKKAKHIQLTNTVLDLTIPCGRELQDADIRKFLAVYNSRANSTAPQRSKASEEA